MQMILQKIKDSAEYDREIALIDLFILLLEENGKLPNKANTRLFMELSEWRDCSLRDGVVSYYEAAEDGTQRCMMAEHAVERYKEHPVVRNYLNGFSAYNGEENIELDNWIFENEWTINDFLADLACEENE